MRVKACWTTKYSWMQGEESDLEACGTTKDSWMQVLPRGGRCVDQGSREYLDLIDFVLKSSQGKVMKARWLMVKFVEAKIPLNCF